MKKKILIVIGDVASGHRSAANALTNAFLELYGDKFDIKTVDLFTYLEVEPFNSADTTHKLLSQNKLYEAINNLLFRLVNTEVVYPLFRWFVASKLLKGTIELLKSEAPDIVISIHPFTSIVLNEVKRGNYLQFKSVTVITDLVTLFRGWADDQADLVFSPTTEATNLLIRWGIDSKRIAYPLFPINPNMRHFRKREVVLKELGLDPSSQTILLTSGGFGMKSLKVAIKKVIKHYPHVQLILLAGKNESFKSYLLNEYSNNTKIAILGFVNNIQDYINASDIVIGKPGPATILEFEVFGKKAIITKKIGEQEIGNIDYALENSNFRYIGEDWSELEPTVEELMELKLPSSSRRKADESLLIAKEIISKTGLS